MKIKNNKVLVELILKLSKHVSITPRKVLLDSICRLLYINRLRFGTLAIE